MVLKVKCSITGVNLIVYPSTVPEQLVGKAVQWFLQNPNLELLDQSQK